MKQLKNFLYTLLGMALVFVLFLYHRPIARFVMENFIYKNDMVIQEKNQYYQELNISYVQETEDFQPKNRQDLLNIIYTILNNGWEEFTFFCDESYESCFNDAKTLTENPEELSNFNNFVHPYNSFNHLYIDINNFGKIHVQVEKTYTAEEIQFIDSEIDRIMGETVNDTMTEVEKIKAIHDYIINHTVYDSEGAENINNENYKNEKATHTAYGTLKYHIALCGGYSDTMALFLDRLNIPNYKISNAEHVWNLVYVNDAWLHVDLTWDDPVVDTHENVLLDHYFLITGTDLLAKDPIHHVFDQNIYKEGI